MRPAVRRRRSFHDWQSAHGSDVLARAYARFDRLRRRRRRVRPRHAVHARLRHRPGRFPCADARTLYHSIEAILDLPDDTRLFTGHDYRPDGREPRWMATVAEHKRDNPNLQDITAERFVVMREGRDADLPLPDLMLAALQINTQGGALPPAESNGQRYLKIPLNQF